jgi:hypothetical protein
MQAAGASYIKNHFNALISGVAIGGAMPITPSQLIADGVLSSSFNDFNVFGQSHVLVVVQPASGYLEGMVFTYGGDDIPDMIAIRVAQAGPANSMVVLSSDPRNFEGAAGGQTVPVASFANSGFAVTAGHLGAHIESAQYAAEAPFLNRYYTGNADDNVMHADLGMNGNNITSAKTVSASLQVTAPMLVDPIAPTYQITPAGLSNINSLSAAGSVTAADFLHLSDRRLKREIGEIPDPLGVIEKLQGHRFFWRDRGTPDIGFVAQEVRDILPEAVEQTPSGFLAVKYDVLAAPLVEAVKSQGRQIREQAALIAELRRRLDQSRLSVSPISPEPSSR